MTSERDGILIESQKRNLIVNADDFGASRGINRGIIECYRRGIVTSTSLMVTGGAVADAVELSSEHPELAVGLHWDVTGESEPSPTLPDEQTMRDEFHRQLDLFVRWMGCLPTHVDSHRHLHLREPIAAIFRELVEPLGLPLRGTAPVRFVGSFYAQPEWRQTDLEKISVSHLLNLLESEVGSGWTEIGCHPGYIDPEFESVYHAEREREIETLTDPAIIQAVRALEVRLTTYAGLATG